MVTLGNQRGTERSVLAWGLVFPHDIVTIPAMPSNAIRVLGISLGNHDSGVCLFEDEKILFAASEERFSRVKKDSRFPFHSLAELIKHHGAHADKIAIAGTDFLASPHFPTLIDQKYVRSNIFRHLLSLMGFYVPSNRELLIQLIRDLGLGGDIAFYDHHACHAASAYYTAGLTDPVVVTVDGAGDGLCATVSTAVDGKLERIHSIPWSVSPGLFYSFITGFLGFKRKHHEGKITGLAAFGNPKAFDMSRFLSYRQSKDGMIGTFQYPFLEAHAIDGMLFRHRIRWHLNIFKKYFTSIRGSKEDIAASAQYALEQTVVPFIKDCLMTTKKKEVALAGGIFANVKLNQRTADLGVEIFVHPAMGDDGVALGAALLAAEPKAFKMGNPYFGPEYSEKEIEKALNGLEYSRPHDLPSVVADVLVEGEPVCLFQGRMEYGPRALGNRSVVCSATDPSINDRLNKKFKRTEFMPFAPVTLKSHENKCFNRVHDRMFPFMTCSVDCTEWMKETQPAVVHVDGTARPQTIEEKDNPFYHAVLSEYEKRTGIPTLINTSFNMHEEPIVCTPDDAVRALLASGLPYMAIGPFWVKNLVGNP